MGSWFVRWCVHWLWGRSNGFMICEVMCSMITRKVKWVHDLWGDVFIDNEKGQMGSCFVRWCVHWLRGRSNEFMICEVMCSLITRQVKWVHDLWGDVFIDYEEVLMSSWFVRWCVHWWRGRSNGFMICEVMCSLMKRQVKWVHDLWGDVFIDYKAGQMGSWFVRWCVHWWRGRSNGFMIWEVMCTLIVRNEMI